MKDKPVIKYAVATFGNGNEEYMRETHGDDCFTDDIGCAIIYNKWTDIHEINKLSEYIVEVEVDEEGGMLVLGKWTVMPNMDEVVRQIKEALELSTPGQWELTDLADRELRITVGYKLTEAGNHQADWIAEMDASDDEKDRERMYSDAYLIANAPDWLRLLIEEREQKDAAIKELQYENAHLQSENEMYQLRLGK